MEDYYIVKELETAKAHIKTLYCECEICEASKQLADIIEERLELEKEKKREKND